MTTGVRGVRASVRGRISLRDRFASLVTRRAVCIVVTSHGVVDVGLSRISCLRDAHVPAASKMSGA